jgi:hypothetical protein
MIFREAYPVGYLVNKILQEEDTYIGALKRLNETEIIAPANYIISGMKNNEGAVIERGCRNIHGFYTLTDKNWFLV